MLTFLFDEQQERETYTAARDREKIEEGKEIGEKKGMEILIDLVKDGLLSLTDAAKRSNMTESEFAELPDMKKADCAKSKVCLNQALLRRLGAAGELLF